MAFPPDEAKLVSIFVQTLLYGAYTVVFVLTIWVLLSRRRKSRPIQDPMLWISVVMFAMASMVRLTTHYCSNIPIADSLRHAFCMQHIAINFTRIIKAFITFRDAPGGPAAFFHQLSEFTQIFGSAVYVAQTLIGDSVVLYRCYVVWGGDVRVVAGPFVLLLGCTACGVGILYSFARVVPEAEIFVAELQHWIVAFFSLTLATNIICTSLVAWRIWWMNRAIMDFATHSYHPIIFLILESGAVYSATLTALLILYRTGSWFQYVLLDAISPIVGLVFSMIIIRIGLGITTMRGSAIATSDSDNVRTTLGGAPRHSIQFVHSVRHASTPDTECDVDDLELHASPGRDKAEQKTIPTSPSAL
ncbi:hypothetical protein C8Q76DRAFT_741007 [Earliella scabrosa]|nr:hypothetical protein C8Q76DRAFT_741007 [Earliella scabrosa]